MSKKILIVEDEPMIGKIIKDKLVREGFEILRAGTGQAGILLAEGEAPDLILLDLTLDDMDGKEALQKLKEKDRTNPIPVVMLIEQARQEELAACTAQGALGAVIKPFKPTQVARLVHQILD